jgi:SNF2 family DNA or RNA helicase
MTYTPRHKPYAHQHEALKRSLNKESFALTMEMGTGKTKVVSDTFGYRTAAKDLNGLLVIARAGVYRLWEKELKEHLDEELYKDLVIGVWRGSPRKRGKMLEEFFNPRNRGRPRALLMNVEAFSTVKDAEAVAKQFLQESKALAAIDESTSIKGHKSERTATINRLALFPWMRRIMSGTINPNTPLDLYSQFEFLDPKILGFSSYYAFRQRYAIMKTMQLQPAMVVNGKKIKAKTAKVVVAFRNQEELARKIAPHSFRVLKEDCLDLPEKIYETRDVPLTAEQERIYNEMKWFATSELDSGGFVTATSVIVRLLRLHQVLCGHTRDEDNQLRVVSSNRLKILMDTMEEAAFEKIIVWCPFIYGIEEIAAELRKAHGPRSVVTYYGATSSDDRVIAVERFQKDDTCQFFIGNQQTAGYGITLTAAKTMIFYSNNYDLEQRLQAEDRPHRIGLHHPLTIIDLQARDTVDGKIITALRKKLDLVSLINNDGYRKWLT